MKSIKITNTEEYIKTRFYILKNGKGEEEVKSDLQNCWFSWDTGIEFEFTSI